MASPSELDETIFPETNLLADELVTKIELAMGNSTKSPNRRSWGQGISRTSEEIVRKISSHLFKKRRIFPTVTGKKPCGISRKPSFLALEFPRCVRKFCKISKGEA